MPKKELERRYLAQLRKCLRDVPTTDADENEPPDFILGGPENRIGIEITEYHHPPDKGERPYQEVQSLKDRVVGHADELHAQANGPPLYVTVIFGPHGRLAKDTVLSIAEGLADAVLAQDAPISVSGPSVDVPRHQLPLEIAKARLYGSVDGKDKLWSSDAGGWVANITPQNVQEEIDRKTRMVRSARTKCDSLWLVIVHDVTHSAPCELTEETLSASYRSPFDRVVWLDPLTPRVFLLSSGAG